MSESLIAALIGAVITLISVITNSNLENKKRKNEMLQKEFEFKRKPLCEVYEKYISIINSFPAVSPNDILKIVEYPPHYSMESFKTIIEILTYRIKECEATLTVNNLGATEMYQTKKEISDMENCITQIEQNKDAYLSAKDAYDKFCISDKKVIDLYAGQNVRNSMVKFEVVLSNLFIAGCDFEDNFNPEKNVLDRARREVISAMRDDIGTNL
jgi:hypothetical protein